MTRGPLQPLITLKLAIQKLVLFPIHLQYPVCGLIQLLNGKAKLLKFLIFDINLSGLYISMYFLKCDLYSDCIRKHTTAF